MSYHVTVLTRAARDAQVIYSWIAQRSLPGAERWFAAYHQALLDLSADPVKHPLASEPALARQHVREAFFSTSHGNIYRLLYLIADDDVRVLRVRGQGQAPVRKRDIQ